MLIVSQFGGVGLRSTAIRSSLPEGTVGKFHPALHARAGHITFTPHGSGSGIGENSEHSLPQIVPPTAFEGHIGLGRHNAPS